MFVNAVYFGDTTGKKSQSTKKSFGGWRCVSRSASAFEQLSGFAARCARAPFCQRLCRWCFSARVRPAHSVFRVFVLSPLVLSLAVWVHTSGRNRIKKNVFPPLWRLNMCLVEEIQSTGHVLPYELCILYAISFWVQSVYPSIRASACIGVCFIKDIRTHRRLCKSYIT